jgi:hypothetical protein
MMRLSLIQGVILDKLKRRAEMAKLAKVAVRKRGSKLNSPRATSKLRHGNAVAGTAEKLENKMIKKFGPDGSKDITSNAKGRAHTLFRHGEKAARIKKKRADADLAKHGYTRLK